MVKELASKGRTDKLHNWQLVRQTLVILHVVGLGMVAQYIWSKGNRVSISTIASRNRQNNRATAVFLQTHNGSAAAVSHLDRNSTDSLPENEDGVQIQAQAQQAADDTTTTTTTTTQVPIQNMSILEYNACCGLGHRLARQTGAYHAAHRLGFKLNVNWPGCGGINVFDELFFPETAADLDYVNSTHEFYGVDNEVPGYGNAWKNCLPEELESNYEMYSSLKRRFKQREMIEAFQREHFEGHFSIGIHVRAGNGEQGDFTDKHREMDVTPHKFAHRVAKNIVDLVRRSNNTLPPVLFVATDTASYVEMFQTELEGVMPVIEWHQEHEAEGEGVFVGQGQKQISNDECMQKWTDMLYDMILLSSTDVLIAGQYSSFSQAMPLSLVLGEDPIVGTGRESFCEVYQDGLELVCYTNKMEWCKETRVTNSLKTLNIDGGRWPHFLQTMHSSELYHKKVGRQ